jgi:hypothetical protein
MTGEKDSPKFNENEFNFSGHDTELSRVQLFLAIAHWSVSHDRLAVLAHARNEWVINSPILCFFLYIFLQNNHDAAEQRLAKEICGRNENNQKSRV